MLMVAYVRNPLREQLVPNIVSSHKEKPGSRADLFEPFLNRGSQVRVLPGASAARVPRREQGARVSAGVGRPRLVRGGLERMSNPVSAAPRSSVSTKGVGGGRRVCRRIVESPGVALVRRSTPTRGAHDPEYIPAMKPTLLLLAVLAQGQDVPVFLDGEAQVVAAFEDPGSWVQHDLWVETGFDSDGDGRPDRMHVDVTRVRQTETQGLKVPVIYETSPYYSGVGSTESRYFWSPEQEVGAPPPERAAMPSIEQVEKRPLVSNSLVRRWVPRGFAVVHSESPGTGLSEGCPTVGAENEALAPKAVIDWLNGRAPGFTTTDGDERVEAYWSTGKVGMTGVSYNGTLPLAAATTGVEGLEVIIPVAANTSYYNYYRSNGLVRHPGGYIGEDIDVLYDFINSGDPDRRDWCNREVRDGEMAKGHDRASGDYNDFWAGRDYRRQLDGVKCATLMAHGLNDWNVMPEHAVSVYEYVAGRGVPAQIFLHQGGHGGSPPDEMMNRWFTRYLHGIENGVEDGPRAWVVREGAKTDAPTPYADYPNPDAGPVRLHPRKPGRLGVARGEGEETLVDDASIRGAELAQAEASPHRLLYTTPALAAPLHVSGYPRVTIRLASSRPAANLSVWLVMLPWDGETRRIGENLVTRGWADPQNRRSLIESDPLVPGEFVDVSFDLQPDDQIVPAGRRLGLMISSSDHEFTLWPKPGTELTIDLASTLLELPVVGGVAAFERAVGE